MSVAAYYNEFDPKAAAWLRELIKQGHIADGEVDERSILDVRPDELRGYTQCHFFAGIGGWSYALRLAGWPDDRPVWTGSPPCQPFSSAGRRDGRDDERHLAPHFVELVRACRPRVLFGEQVASADVFGKVAGGARKQVAGTPQWAWFDDLSDRLEAARYAVGASDIPSAGVGAPHIRQRTFFGAVGLADATSGGRRKECQDGGGFRARDCKEGRTAGCDAGGEHGGLADADDAGSQGHGRPLEQHDAQGREVTAGWSAESGEHGGMADATGGELGVGAIQSSRQHGFQPQDRGAGREGCGGPQHTGPDGMGSHRTCPTDSPWRDADWLFCRDGKWRPVEPSTSPLAHGIPARVGRLRGYGNAINPWAAKAFIEAFDDVIEVAA